MWFLSFFSLLLRMCVISGPKSVLVRKEHTGLHFVFTSLWSTGVLCFTIWHCRFTKYASYEPQNSEKRNTVFRLQTSQDNRMPLMLLLYSIKATLFFTPENVDTAVPASCVHSKVVLCYRFLLLFQTNAESDITHAVHYYYNQSHLPPNAHNWF